MLQFNKAAAARAQGGPGCASSGGGFLREHGPWFPNADVQDNGLRRNDFSWNRAASVIYLDQPAYTGFSYSNRSSDRYAGARRARPARRLRGACNVRQPCTWPRASAACKCVVFLHSTQFSALRSIPWNS